VTLVPFEESLIFLKLINYHPSSSLSKPLKWEDKDAKPDAASNSTESPSLVPANEAKRIRSVCMACFACDKNNMTLCARCFIRGNYRIGMSNTEFKRVEISEETKNEWTEEETLNLLEAITNFGDDWKRVAHQVVGRTDKECVARFLELPFGDQLKPPVDAECESEIVAWVNLVSECVSHLLRMLAILSWLRLLSFLLWQRRRLHKLQLKLV